MVSLLDSPEMSKDACIKCHDGGARRGVVLLEGSGSLGGSYLCSHFSINVVE